MTTSFDPFENGRPIAVTLDEMPDVLSAPEAARLVNWNRPPWRDTPILDRITAEVDKAHGRLIKSAVAGLMQLCEDMRVDPSPHTADEIVRLARLLKRIS